MAKIPDEIGKYKIEKLIAKGGMGAVFKGTHPTLNKKVILKKLTLRGKRAIAERFKREARLMMDFKHENIVDVYDHFKEGVSYYIVLEYIDGKALDALLKKERYLPDDIALLIFLDACKALHYAHKKGVVHRDIKPGNILINKEGEAKLVDFGIASSREDQDTGLTQEGMTLGTPSYMAPEQFHSTRTVDARADIYSMGVTLYETLTGKKPYPGAFSAETLTQIQKGKYVSPKKINPEIGSASMRVISKCMRAKREKRYKDLSKVIHYLQNYFKRRNVAELRKQLSCLITEQEYKPKALRKSHKAFKRLSTALTTAAFITAAGFGIHYLGLHHEILPSRTYGALTLKALIPRDNRQPQDHYLGAILYRQRDNTLDRLNKDPLSFRLELGNTSETTYYFNTKKLYLEAGKYRAKLMLDDQISWHTFYLNPRAVQRNDSQNKTSHTITIEKDAGRSLPLKVDFKIWDNFTGQDLTRSTRIQVKYRGQWTSFTPSIAVKLKTGQRHDFQFSKTGYETNVYYLLVEPHQTALSLQSALLPLKGTFKFNQSVKGLKWTLSGDPRKLSGGKITGAVGDHKFQIYPGKYELTVQYRGIKETRTITIQSRKTFSLSASYDMDNKVINLK